jgi:hypothetical protein
MTVPIPHESITVTTMENNEHAINRVEDEFARFQRTMEELRLLKNVAEDLKSFRKMIRLKRYD